MKILHTSDWHVGKVLKGRDRHDEHAAVLRSIVQTARDEDVDLVLIAGDLFDTAAPSAKAQGLVMTRSAGAARGRPPGGRDRREPRQSRACSTRCTGRCSASSACTCWASRSARPTAACCTCALASGETVNIAALPFLSHRYAVGAAEALLHEFSEHSRRLPRQVSAMVGLLTEGFTPTAVNVVMAHATLLGGRRGGGERDVQTSLDYEVPSSMFPPGAHYAALGHLHRQQEIPGPCPAFYSGSPLHIDFGEELERTQRPDHHRRTRRPGGHQAGAGHRRQAAADPARHARRGDRRERGGG